MAKIELQFEKWIHIIVSISAERASMIWTRDRQAVCIMIMIHFVHIAFCMYIFYMYNVYILSVLCLCRVNFNEMKEKLKRYKYINICIYEKKKRHTTNSCVVFAVSVLSLRRLCFNVKKNVCFDIIDGVASQEWGFF